MPADIPAPLDLVADFVNTLDVYQRDDRLETPAALAAWLRAHGLLDPATEVDDDDLTRALELREALRALLLANNAGELDAGSIGVLNRVAAGVPLEVRFSAADSELRPQRRDARGALNAIVAAVHRGMLEGTWHRLKACRSEDCEWVFYDRSRNQSARWCTMKVCGNRNKARRFRAKHSHAATTA